MKVKEMKGFDEGERLMKEMKCFDEGERLVKEMKTHSSEML